MRTRVNRREANESKRDYFIRVATTKTNHILDVLDTFEKWSDRSRYEYTPEDIEKIFNKLTEVLEATKTYLLMCSKDAFTLD